ncbi:hypothetical protein QEN19_001852 [Hanseniaspora menglaensis]
MPIDYSKWDKLELSDDSDIEVHPNVDKNSFIRWKQQDIHQKREERNAEIKTLEQQMEMYTQLNKRVDFLLKKQDGAILVNLSKLQEILNSNFDKLEKCEGDRIDKDIPPYNEMVSDLFEQFINELKKSGPVSQEKMILKIIEHRAKIEEVSKQGKEKLATLYKEKELHISSDDIHDGWNSSFVNKQNLAEKNAPKAGENKAVVPKDLGLKEFIQYEGEENVLQLHPLTIEFGNIEEENLQETERFLLQHYEIISSQQSDALMMSSFNHELELKTKLTHRAIFQSEVLSSIAQMYQLRYKGDSSRYIHSGELQDIIKKFFFKLKENRGDNMARTFFEKEVTTKYEHVQKRAIVMRQEQDEQEEDMVETIQLRSMDPDSKLIINLPDFSSQDTVEQQRCALFNEIPEALRNALLTGELDAVNEVLGTMSVEEGEQMLEIFNAGGFLGIQELFENPEEFEAYKKDFEQNAINEEEVKAVPTYMDELD